MDNDSLLLFERRRNLITAALVLLLLAINVYSFIRIQPSLSTNPTSTFSEQKTKQNILASTGRNPWTGAKLSAETPHSGADSRLVASVPNSAIYNDIPNNVIQWDCRSVPQPVRISEELIRLVIKNCENTNARFQITNKTNGYTAETILTKPNVWTTDYINLKSGANEIVVSVDGNSKKVSFSVFKEDLIGVSESE